MASSKGLPSGPLSFHLKSARFRRHISSMILVASNVFALLSRMVFSKRAHCPLTQVVAWQLKQTACIFSRRTFISLSVIRYFEANSPSNAVGRDCPSLFRILVVSGSLGDGWA